LRVQRVAEIQRLLGGVDAGAVGGIGGMQRLDRQRHARLPCVFHHLGDGIVNLRPGFHDVL
jgi:hypothetical protein